MELEQRIMIGTEPPGQAFSGNGPIDHATESHSIYGERMHTEANGAAAKLIHDDQDPMCLEQDRLSSEQVHAPETVLGVAEKRQPRTSALSPFRTVMQSQNTTDHVFGDLQAKRVGEECRLRYASQPKRPRLN